MVSAEKFQGREAEEKGGPGKSRPVRRAGRGQPFVDPPRGEEEQGDGEATEADGRDRHAGVADWRVGEATQQRGGQKGSNEEVGWPGARQAGDGAGGEQAGHRQGCGGEAGWELKRVEECGASLDGGCGCEREEREGDNVLRG